MFKDSKIYVAGHRGLLGTALLKRFGADGYANILTRTHDALDLTDQAAVAEFFARERPEYVFLAAGLTGGIVANKTYPATFLHTNLAMQDNVFEAAQKFDTKHVVFYGSTCSYPKHCAQPMKEEDFLTGPIEATSEAYAAAKIAGILGCRAYNNESGNGRFIALTPNSMYGPGDNFDLESSHVLSALIRRFHEAKIGGLDSITLWGTGSPRREFIFSEEVADASVFAVLNAEKLENRFYNVGTGIDISIKELAERIAGLVGYEGVIEWDTAKPDGAPRKLLASTRFRELGWSPPGTLLEEGLIKTYEWFKENYVSEGAGL